MRQNQIAIDQHQIIVAEDVEVDRPRSPPPFARPVAPEFPLELRGKREQIVRCKRRCHRDDRIDEWRLLGDAPWRRPGIGRADGYSHRLVFGQQRYGLIERRPDVAHIAAQRDESLGHGFGYCPRPWRVRVTITPTSSKAAAIGACGLRTVTRTPRTCG